MIFSLRDQTYFVLVLWFVCRDPQEMESAGINANVVVYNSALDACGKAGNPEAAAKVLRRMTETGRKEKMG